jgi:hypothetical protein
VPTYYLGLDVHKVRTQYCLTDPAGEILAVGRLPTEEVATVKSGEDVARWMAGTHPIDGGYTAQ